jgi:uncharacterized membrane protein YphA (DoxX/SURF4 family)
MSIIFAIFSIAIALVALISSAVDFKGDPKIEDLMKRLGYRSGFERTLGVIKTLGGIGLIIGLFVHVLGIIAAGAFTVYFVLAIRAHRSIDDPAKETAPAIGLAAMSLIAFLAGLAS